MRKLYKIRIEADDETIFYAHIRRESYGKDIAIAVKDRDKDEVEQCYIVLKKN